MKNKIRFMLYTIFGMIIIAGLTFATQTRITDTTSEFNDITQNGHNVLDTSSNIADYITPDSIGDTQIDDSYINQDLTTSSSPTFINGLFTNEVNATTFYQNHSKVTTTETDFVTICKSNACDYVVSDEPDDILTQLNLAITENYEKSIMIMNGLYYVNNTQINIYANNTLIRGESRGGTVIKTVNFVGFNDSNYYQLIRVHGNNNDFTEFTIDGNTANNYGSPEIMGIYSFGDFNKFHNINFYNIRDGIVIDGGDFNQIINNFFKNTVEYATNIRNYASYNIISGNTYRNCKSSFADGTWTDRKCIHLDTSHYSIVTNNNIKIARTGIYLEGTNYRALISGNIITDGDNGMLLGDGIGLDVNHNIISGYNGSAINSQAINSNINHNTIMGGAIYGLYIHSPGINSTYAFNDLSRDTSITQYTSVSGNTYILNKYSSSAFDMSRSSVYNLVRLGIGMDESEVINADSILGIMAGGQKGLIINGTSTTASDYGLEITSGGYHRLLYLNQPANTDTLLIHSEATSNPAITMHDIPSNKSIAIASGDKICFDYTTCSKSITNDGSQFKVTDDLDMNDNAITDASTLREVSDEGLVLGMNFNSEDITGTTVLDSSGQGNDGTNNGATFNATGGFNGGGAFEFDGVSNNYLTLLSHPMDYGKTVSFWIKPTSQSNNFVFGTSSYPYLYFRDLNGGKKRMLVRSGSGNYRYSNYDIIPNQWHHIAIFWSNNCTLTQIYINGKPSMGAHSADGQPFSSWETTQYIGFSNGYNFNGSIDDIRIYNRSLSATEIQNLYEQRAEVKNPYVSRKGDSIKGDLLIDNGDYVQWSSGAKITSNSTCLILTSPDGTGQVNVCNT